MEIKLPAALLAAYAWMSLFAHFVFHSYYSLHFREAADLFRGKLPNNQLTRFDWAFECKMSFEEALKVGFIAGTTLAILVLVYLWIVTNGDATKGIRRFLRNTPVTFFLYLGAYAAFFYYADPHVFTAGLNDLTVCFGFAGVLTTSAWVWLNFSTLPISKDHKIEANYLSARLAYTQQMTNYAVTAMIGGIAYVGVASILQEYTYTPLELLNSYEYKLTLGAFAVWAALLVIGWFLGIFHQLSAHASEILERFVQIENDSSLSTELKEMQERLANLEKVFTEKLKIKES